jgi:hypothetical protein
MNRGFCLTGKVLVFLLLTIVLAGCLAGPDSRWNDTPMPRDPPKAGFFAGLWHGLIAVITLILGIFTDFKVYEIHNSGWFYDLGFLIGVGAFSHGGVNVVCKRGKKD